MTEISRSALVPYSPEQMFDVVKDVESYGEFLPWCAEGRLISETENEMVGGMDIARAGISQSLTTRNEFERPTYMKIELVEGPFSRFSGRWDFDALGDVGCKVSLRLAFEIDGKVMNMAFGKLFNAAADRLVDAFCERAETLYGRPDSS